MAVLTATDAAECLWQNYNWHVSVLLVFSRKTSCLRMYGLAGFILQHHICCMMRILAFAYIYTQSRAVKRPCHTSTIPPTFYVAPSVPRPYNYPHYCFLLGQTRTRSHTLKSKHAHIRIKHLQSNLFVYSTLHTFTNKQTFKAVN